jgi:hypothetical protein
MPEQSKPIAVIAAVALASCSGGDNGFRELEGTPDRPLETVALRLPSSADIMHDMICDFTFPEGVSVDYDPLCFLTPLIRNLSRRFLTSSRSRVLCRFDLAYSEQPVKNQAIAESDVRGWKPQTRRYIYLRHPGSKPKWKALPPPDEGYPTWFVPLPQEDERPVSMPANGTPQR